MLYRYAKAQGKDVSVKDADAALAAYKDGDLVSALGQDRHGLVRRERHLRRRHRRALGQPEHPARRRRLIAVRFQPEALPEA